MFVPLASEVGQCFLAMLNVVPHIMDSSDVIWLEPWQPVARFAIQETLSQELRSELCLKHALSGLPARAIAVRQDCDDVLFELLDKSGRVAVVHLTYAQHPEMNASFPNTTIFEDLNEFIEKAMRVDHAKWKQ